MAGSRQAESAVGEYYVLPTVSLCFGGLATQARQARSSMLEVIRADYVVTARSKGLTQREVILKHALPNAIEPDHYTGRNKPCGYFRRFHCYRKRILISGNRPVYDYGDQSA
ncbi:MAG: ABC transporter permease subunit [Pilosibacter sp.]